MRTSLNINKIFLLILISIIIPKIANAQAHGLLEAVIGFFLFIIILISMIPLYLLRNKNHLIFLSVDIAFAIVYSLIIFVKFPSHYPESIIYFVIFLLTILSAVLGMILFFKKRQNGDISSLKKVFLHTITIGIFTIFLYSLFNYSARQILSSSTCNINLFSGFYQRKNEWDDCINEKAIERSNPEFCDKIQGLDLRELDDSKKDIESCKLKVAIKMLKAGNLLGCNYLNKDTLIYYEGSHGLILGDAKKFRTVCEMPQLN